MNQIKQAIIVNFKFALNDGDDSGGGKGLGDTCEGQHRLWVMSNGRRRREGMHMKGEKDGR